MNARPSNPVRIRVVESDSEFAALEAPWEALQQDSAVTSVFETFDWQYLWWQTYGRGQPLKLLLATIDDRLVGILPLYLETVSIVSPVRILRLVGVGGDTSPDDLGPLLAAGLEKVVAHALADAVLQMGGWDALCLEEVQPENAFLGALRERAAAAGLSLRSRRAERIAYLDLPASYDAWLQSLHGDRRYRIKNIRKKLNAAHPTRFFVWDDPATIDEGIATLVRLHKKRWQTSGQSRSFGTAKYIEFHSAVIRACRDRDRVRLYCLELSGAVVAMFYFYKFRDRVYLMQSGFDPDFSKLKPGQALLGYIIEHAIGEKQTVLDFLRGDHRYKDELATGERETVHLEVFRPTLGAYLYRTRRIYLPAIKAAIKAAVKAPMKGPMKARLLQLRQRFRGTAASAPPPGPSE
jgi:CelD/BcsL family acetyltransferase involved in cellulose biosynthesis